MQKYRDRMVKNLHSSAQALGFDLVAQPLHPAYSHGWVFLRSRGTGGTPPATNERNS
ncbi:hypothetical protein [Tolypothrix sp. VBCCA 56010]|uniref:hypothetical protein n=1 Tax=Tolypothrix sp. VBCCA 56010 TaxID=3137731 RepID=UPI003D7EF651